MLSRIAKDPLFHFLLIGLLLFPVFALVSPSSGGDGEIVITKGVVEDIRTQHKTLWGKQPDESELAALIDKRIDDEILYREGVALGFDQDDAYIKRRVRQKYELVAEEQGSVAPSDADLATYLETHAGKFRASPIVTFSQVKLSDEAAEEGEPAFLRLKAALEEGGDPAALNGNSVLRTAYAESSLDVVTADFGTEFTDQLKRLPVGSWQGPVVSSYGIHIVRVDRIVNPGIPRLADVRDRVEREWENERRVAAMTSHVAELRRKYTIRVEAD